MASKEIDKTTGEITGYADFAGEWETVHIESGTQVLFENIGDTFIGKYVGKEVIPFVDKRGTDLTLVQLQFLVRDEPFFINAGYDLRKACEGLEPGKMTRIQLRQLVDTGAPEPMKSYRIDVARD